ncbi:TPA: hypothetical protein DD690_00070 [Candidatus Daviesbacteria bacterium]|uniref:Type II secretion system protein GspG C-terminal domain-containing protein n=1 Tax=Candidatus Daviesbacteria bacterium GW2011_GWF2_38_6 TaxID=1618432 RepID=A0A0G0KJC0_9BACT|nr:MAG: hypothetical protein US99_C0009G0023 [Candidatus Daviesbacteria bacterium GW2011_GWF2_38_6]OGE27111.1 MAG: hypothetical protein A2772_02685 [Candidatus Daviesbacteria bacterium RIFCSPHIGHO2_01_FULL_38_8b]OGE27532.1 MAG: hypothetical protein A3D02_02305 [Candidatus Daviesbacteria bacterium RIFCSPHIGHO2_02_FULL_39_41]OGE44080.1 MAG: hypothetical protein A3E67_00200 [Candidatus Daviesbacteria bacterium RIFCSPHIGHO2_12_FULL_38_25]OGE68265.1 MAG: hypothetical protein A3H81_01300 [Candidatus 
MKLLLIGIVLFLVSMIVIVLVFKLGFPFLYALGIKQAAQETISLKGRYEGIADFPDLKPITALSYDNARISDLSELQQALEEFKRDNSSTSYPIDAREYATITKYLTISGNKLRKDPVANNEYCYSMGSDGRSYSITTVLQSPTASKKNNTDVSQICTFPENMKVICSPSLKCYQIKAL